MDHETLERLVRKLPDCPGILAREKFFNSAVLVPLVYSGNEFHLLFEKRAASIRQGSEICFPGGKHDPGTDRDCIETAVRETVEELGIPKNRIKIMGRFDTLVASMGATVEPVLAVVSMRHPDDLTVNWREVEDAFLLPVSFFLNNKAETYNVRLIVEPHYTDKDGKEVTLLPSKKLGLPELYHKPWGKAIHRVLVYKTPKGPIWGITAEIIHDLVMKIL
jgi:8-oxo-dGTP pyrophosphatase MutT (NUDIX family)